MKQTNTDTARDTIPFLFHRRFRLICFCQRFSIRQSIGEIRKDLEIMWAPRASSENRATTLAAKGGAYRTSGTNSVFFHLYTGVRFGPLL